MNKILLLLIVAFTSCYENSPVRALSVGNNSEAGSNARFEKKVIDTPCIQAIVDEKGNIVYQNDNAAYKIVMSSISGGTGINNNGGNRYQLAFSDDLPKYQYPIITALRGVKPNALIVGDVDMDSNTIEYGFYSGDDGAGIDDAKPTLHHIRIDGCSESLNVLIQNE